MEGVVGQAHKTATTVKKVLDQVQGFSPCQNRLRGLSQRVKRGKKADAKERLRWDPRYCKPSGEWEVCPQPSPRRRYSLAVAKQPPPALKHDDEG